MGVEKIKENNENKKKISTLSVKSIDIFQKIFHSISVEYDDLCFSIAEVKRDRD